MTLARALPRFAILAALCGVPAVGAAVHAQGRSEPPESLAGVIAELRLLRAAVEEANRRQSQIQMLSVSLSAQQSRLVETAKRLDTTRRELREAVARTEETLRVMKMFQQDPAQPFEATFPPEAAGLAEMFKPQLEAARHREAQLRAREAELLQALQAEEARWTDLVAQLHASVND